ACLLSSTERNLREIFGRRFNVHCRVSQEVEITLPGNEEVDPAYLVNTLADADDLESRTDGIGVIACDARDDGISIAHANHHGTEDRAIQYQFLGRREGNAAPLT